jgi:hypothetical protein
VFEASNRQPCQLHLDVLEPRLTSTDYVKPVDFSDYLCLSFRCPALQLRPGLPIALALKLSSMVPTHGFVRPFGSLVRTRHVLWLGGVRWGPHPTGCLGSTIHSEGCVDEDWTYAAT